jgi:hypothetical protein
MYRPLYNLGPPLGPGTGCEHELLTYLPPKLSGPRIGPVHTALPKRTDCPFAFALFLASASLVASSRRVSRVFRSCHCQYLHTNTHRGDIAPPPHLASFTLHYQTHSDCCTTNREVASRRSSSSSPPPKLRPPGARLDHIEPTANTYVSGDVFRFHPDFFPFL